MKSIVFKIETAGLPKDEILHLMPHFEAPSNYKDAEKIQAYKAKKEEEWLLDSASSPLSGKILAIGVQPDGGVFELISDDDEAELLTRFWAFYRENSDAAFVGFGTSLFDIPYILKRSWKHSVMVPFGIVNGRFLNGNFADLLQHWGCGQSERASLNNVAKFFGIEEDATDGSKFSDMWLVNREAASSQLESKLRFVRTIGERLGVIDEEDGF